MGKTDPQGLPLTLSTRTKTLVQNKEGFVRGLLVFVFCLKFSYAVESTQHPPDLD